MQGEPQKVETNGFIKKLIAKMSLEAPEKNAFSIKDGINDRDISYQEFYRDIMTAAGWFRAHGIQGQHIALIAPSDYWYFVALFGSIASGNRPVLVNPELPGDMIRTLCGKTDIAIAFTSDTLLQELQGELNVGTWILPSILTQSAPLALEDVHIAQENEPIFLLFSSGTTGVSKAVQVTSWGLQSTAQFLADYYEGAGLESAYHVIPRHHCIGILLVYVCFLRGETLNIGKSVQYLTANLSAFNPSYVVMVPAMASSLVRLLKRAKDQAAREKIAGKNLKRICLLGAAVSPVLAQDLTDLGIEIESSYGMTEAYAVTWSVLSGDKISSVGQVRPDAQMRIQNGEIQVKSPGIMKGYYNQPDETAKVLVDGWVHTGDLGHIDEDGYCYITGRIKNVIILSNGENVSPEEIEEKLGSCEDVLECMVYSDGKGICADIYTQKPDAVETFVRNYNDAVPMYRQVYKVNCTPDPLEKTGSGKIKRKENVYV